MQWTDETWLAGACGWIAEHVAIAGALDQRHVRPWATVIRVPTADGDVWFKANSPELRHEAALVERLAARRPESVPPLIAADPQRGWMLMRDAGERMREVTARTRDLSPWLEILPQYAELQLAMAGDADALVAAGVPDLRLEHLPAAFAPFVADQPEAASGLDEACAELASLGIPETVQHDDLHDGQVYVRDGRYAILDWGDACVTHPFLSLAVTLGGFLSWGPDDVEGSLDTTAFRDTYLEPFTSFASRPELTRTAELAMHVGWACRVVNGELGDPDPASSAVRLEMFLKTRP